MNREIEQSLLEWKLRPNRKPLILRGARQVGKTFTVEQFAKAHFENHVKINLEEKPEMRQLFDQNDAKLIVNQIAVILDIDISAGKTLLFIDEIQTYPKAIQTLRYFYEQMPDLHILAAGSLLDFALNDMQYSMPVGRVEFCYMYPMNFSEFLLANSQIRLVEYIQNFNFQEEFSLVIHQKILEYLRLYFFIGGMPEAVRIYIETGKFTEVERIHSNIITSLIYDFAKYGTRKQQENMTTVLLYTASNVGRKIKYVNIDKETRSTFLKEAFYRLELSRVIHLVRHTNVSGVPIDDFINNDIFKPIFLDIGLVNHIGKIQLIDIENLITKNEGMLAEQFVGQELIATGKPWFDNKLFYWMREEKNSNAETDYIFQHNNTLYPVEVKAGKTGTLKSMHIYLYEKKLNTGIRFNLDLPTIGEFSISLKNMKTEDTLHYKLISLPLYFCFVLPQILNKSDLLVK
ncbi:MAG: AAA family ATPase [Bacteroidales bacterium]